MEVSIQDILGYMLEYLCPLEQCSGYLQGLNCINSHLVGLKSVSTDQDAISAFSASKIHLNTLVEENCLQLLCGHRNKSRL